MNCVENLHKAIILTWIGDYKTANELAKQCLDILSDAREINKKVKEVLRETDKEHLIPKKLREKGITTTDLIQLALFYLAKRLSRREENVLEIMEKNGVRFSIIQNGNKKEIRGYCETCKGYKYSLLKNAYGYYIIYDEIIFSEFFQGDLNDVIDEILNNIKF